MWKTCENMKTDTDNAVIKQTYVHLLEFQQETSEERDFVTALILTM